MRVARSVAIGVLLLLSFTVVAQAQAQTKPPQFIQVATINLKASMIPEWEDFQKKLNAARDKTPGSPLSTVYAVTLGAPGATYMVVTPFENFADREKWPAVPAMLAKVYGQAEANRLLKTVREATEHQEIEVFNYRPAASVNARPFDPPAPFISVQRTEVDPEMNAQYLEFMDKLKTAREKAKYPLAVTVRTSIYGVAFTTVAATYLTKLSDRDLDITPTNAEALRQAFGEAEATRLLAIPNRGIKNRWNLFLTYRADLSRPKVTSSN